MTTFIDTAALLRVASVQTNGLGIKSPSPTECWDLASRSMVAITSPGRLGNGDVMTGSRVSLINDILSNLVAFPKMKFTVPTVAPLQPVKADSFVTSSPSDMVVNGLRSGCLSSIALQRGKSLAVGLIARNVAPSSCWKGIEAWAQGHGWQPHGVLLSCHQDLSMAGPNVVALHANSAVTSLLKLTIPSEDGAEARTKFTEAGVEEQELVEAVQDVRAPRSWDLTTLGEASSRPPPPPCRWCLLARWSARSLQVGLGREPLAFAGCFAVSLQVGLCSEPLHSMVH